MDNTLAKKIGEVLAFERGLAELFDKGRVGLKSFWDDVGVDTVIKQASVRATNIENWSSGAGVAEVVMAKAEGTGNKLIAMRDMYLQDHWDDGVEILEWLGFLEGAAIVHCSLVVEGGKVSGYEDLTHLATVAYDFHSDFLSQVSKLIKLRFKK